MTDPTTVHHRITTPTAPEIPLFFDSPHSGTDYPADFGFAAPFELLATGEDTHVEKLIAAAPDHGIGVLDALFPRSYVDVNRAEDDIDPDLLGEPWPTPLAPGQKSSLGIGLIRRLAVPGVPVHDRKLTVAEVRHRIDAYYRPYHAALADRLDALHARFGQVWYVDWHSMKSVGNEMTLDAGATRPDMVVSDRRGATCDPAFTEAVARSFRDRGYRVTINDPYQGAELIIRHGRPAERRHSLQIELNRRLYMDEKTRVPNDHFVKLKADLDGVIAEMAAFVRARST